MRATYNITTNRFKLYTENERLTPEQVTQAKKCNFVFYFGQKCWSSIWYPQSEDFIKSLGVEIEEDDTPDDVEARVNRFEKYAESATKAAEYATERAANANTERRERLAFNSAISETERAQYWNDRIAGAISNAQYKDRPDVIARRIKGLEKDLRKHEEVIKKYHALKWKTLEDLINLFNVHSFWMSKTQEERDQAAFEMFSKNESAFNHSRRWAEHLNRRIAYEKAYLEAVGGNPIDKLESIKAGDLVVYRGEVYKAAKINKTTIQLTNAGEGYPQREFYPVGAKIDKTKLQPYEA